MMVRFNRRMLSEVDKRLLFKFAFNFGWKGMLSVNKFQKRLKHGKFFPAFVFISVTNSCNLSCQGCWVTPTSPARQLPAETLRRIVVESKKQGSYFFGILGGEPLLYDGLFDVFAENPDSYFLLFTNGTLITDEAAERMREVGNVSPLISIEGKEDVSDVRRGSQNVYAKTLQGLRRCTHNRLVTGVATSVCKSNIDDLASEAFVNELVELGVHYVWYYIYRPAGPNPSSELALSQEQIIKLRRFLVDIRTKAPILVVDAYWDHEGKALCPAATGISHHISPAGDVEPCPPIQFAMDNVGDGSELYDKFNNSEFLADFRKFTAETTRGCILLEDPRHLCAFMRSENAVDSSGRGTVIQEIEKLGVCPSHHIPGQEIPEKNWMYRFAKKNWFFGFGAYG